MLKVAQAPTNAAALKLRLDRARLLAARLHGIREADEKQLKDLTTKVGVAKARNELGEEVTRIFEAMQSRAHSRSVGTFETLLTAILQDVLPEKGRVCFDLSSSNNAPNLDIFVENDGNPENILEGNGGAVTNVVSAGLRFAALTRTQNRRLMVLDEPDCWLKASRLPAFVQVIADVARETKTQTLLISHKDPAYFRSRINVLEMSKNANGLVQVSVCDPVVTDWESATQPGIRSIRLVNFRAHTDTTLKLLPGVTALIGDNDLGKSTALVAAFKAVAYNESDDTVIRHGFNEAQVVIEMESDKHLIWSRKRKGSPKVVYALYHGTELVAEGKAPGRGSVPDWVTSELGISEVDGLDIQIGSQKNPVFLLDQPASKRAQLLSVGRESGYLVSVMDAWGDIKRNDRQTVKDGEASITRLSYRLGRMEALDSLVSACEKLTTSFSVLDNFAERFSMLAKLVGRMGEASKAISDLALENTVLESFPEAPPILTDLRPLVAVLERVSRGLPFKDVELPRFQAGLPELLDTTDLQKLVVRISQSQPFGELELPDFHSPLPELKDTNALQKLGGVLALLRKFQPLFDAELPVLPEAPVLLDDRALQSTTTRLAALRNGVELAQTEQAEANADFDVATVEMSALQKRLGGICPLCSHEFSKGHSHELME